MRTGKLAAGHRYQPASGDRLKARLIHPEFFTDVRVCALSAYARLLLMGLWLHSDDHGRANYLPKLIAGEVFPHEHVDVEPLLTEIREAGLIRVYEVRGQSYFLVPTWDKWQKPKYKADSKIPLPKRRTSGQRGKTFGQDGEILGQADPKPSNRSRSKSVLESKSGFKGQDSSGPPKWPLVLAESEKGRESS